MIVYTFINIVFALVILCFPLYWSSRWLKLPILNPVSVIVIASLPFSLARYTAPMLILNDLQLVGLNIAIFNDNIYGLFGIMNLYLAYKTGYYRHLTKVIPKSGNFVNIDFSRLANIFFILFVIVFLTLTQKTGGLFDWLGNIRESYMSKRDGNGIYYATALSCLSLAIFFKVSICQTRLQILIWVIIFTFFGYLFGTKGFLLQILVFITAIYLLKFPRHSLLQFLIILPLVILVLLLNFFNGIDGFDMLVLVNYFNYYYNAAIYYTDFFAGSIDLFDGKILASTFWQYVPRNIYPDKPYVYGVLHVVEHYYPGGPESGNTPAFLGQVSRFADYGFPGFLLLSLFNFQQVMFFIISTQLVKFSNFTKGMQAMIDGRVVICSITLLAPGFGTFFPLFLYLFLTLSIFIFSKYFKSSVRIFVLALK